MGFIDSAVNNYSKIIWDFDGTIATLHVDWAGLRSALEAALRERDPAAADSAQRLNEYYAALCKRGARSEALAIIDTYESVADYTVVQESVDWLTSADCYPQTDMAIVSDNLHATIERALAELGVLDRFAIIIAKDDVMESKPHPEGVYSAMKALADSDKMHYRMIGNSETDVQTAESAGIAYAIIPELTA